MEDRQLSPSSPHLGLKLAVIKNSHPIATLAENEQPLSIDVAGNIFVEKGASDGADICSAVSLIFLSFALNNRQTSPRVAVAVIVPRFRSIQDS